MTKKKAIIICGHGSRKQQAIKEFHQFTKKFARRFNDIDINYGYLEFANPNIVESLDILREKNVTEIYALPAMLFAAGHVKNDIPALLKEYQQKYPHINIKYARELGMTTTMINAAASRIRDAINKTKKIPTKDTMLIVVGRGASDPDANSNIAKISRILWEGLGFGWAEYAFSGMTFPLVKPALENAIKLGFPKIIVFPYFLFTGILVDRIYAQTDEVQKLNPKCELVKCQYLKDHKLVIDTFIHRLKEIDDGENLMNCQLCMYRDFLPGFEHKKGEIQTSHHHHAQAKTSHHHTQASHHHTNIKA